MKREYLSKYDHFYGGVLQMFATQGARYIFPLMLCCLFTAIPVFSVTPAPLSGLKIVCVWSVVAHTVEEEREVVARAAEIGFNGICWDRQSVPDACRNNGLKSFIIIRPLERRPEAQLQVLEPGEDTLAGFVPDEIPSEQYYQYGGEPLSGNIEILDQNFTCPNDPGVVGYSIGRVKEAMAAGYDGIIWDFVGYRNYHSCNCPFCRNGLAEYRAANPELSDKESAAKFYKNVLVDLYDTLYVLTKKIAPDLIVANHIHPVYMPDLFYGRRVNTDYCGITVSWFFKPHWPLEKVGDYVRKVLNGPYEHKHVQGMPMIGFYTDWPDSRDRKYPDRVRQEFEILRQAGAQHLMFCELGHILRDREVCEVIKEILAGN
jgi:hypothetical protein